MTWTLVFLLAAGAYFFKALGLVVIGDRPLPPVLERCLSLIPAALIAALIFKDTFSIGQHLQIDADDKPAAGSIVQRRPRAPGETAGGGARKGHHSEQQHDPAEPRVDDEQHVIHADIVARNCQAQVVRWRICAAA